MNDSASRQKKVGTSASMFLSKSILRFVLEKSEIRLKIQIPCGGSTSADNVWNFTSTMEIRDWCSASLAVLLVLKSKV